MEKKFICTNKKYFKNVCTTQFYFKQCQFPKNICTFVCNDLRITITQLELNISDALIKCTSTHNITQLAIQAHSEWTQEMFAAVFQVWNIHQNMVWLHH